jgi:hypothetical protein
MIQPPTPDQPRQWDGKHSGPGFSILAMRRAWCPRSWPAADQYKINNGGGAIVARYAAIASIT